MTASDLLRDILRTAHVTGLSREHQEAIEEALAALVYEAAARASVRGMSETPSLVLSLKAVRDVAADLEALARDFPGMPREMADRVKANAAALRAIGGPIDPNVPVGA